MPDHAAQAVNQRGERDCPRCVAVAPYLVARASEIAQRGTIFVDSDLETDRRTVVHSLLRNQHRFARSFLRLATDLLEHIPHGHFGVRLNVIHVRLDDAKAVSVDEFPHELNSLLISGNLSLQIGEIVRQIPGSDGSLRSRWRR